MSPAAFLLRLFLAVVLIANGIGAPPAAAAVPASTADSAAPPCHGAAQDEVAAGAIAAPPGVPMDCCDDRGACACIHACPGLPTAAAVIAGVPVHDAAPARVPPSYGFEPPSRLHRPPIA
ncbi:MAG TPA: CopL family metal-binding regulatory protein [Dokdonella sp.]|uniref:CopL family metal-binding regulatory protein n=1 Tax=Dokdonella sp. TaxID=2291710 RepID=UPI002B7E19DC|nr:CopL family metal-binding regulatory protein [Dokdonella sp.]HUD43738.1 CopL family metal-binding regulatory protein [Dokdonella sp.]